MKKLFVPFVLFFVFYNSTVTFAAEQEQSWDLARIVSVEDGDTIKVRLEINKTLRNIRLIGIQAFEEKTTTNLHAACGAKQATKELKKILKKGDWVQLRSVKSTSKNRKFSEVVQNVYGAPLNKLYANSANYMLSAFHYLNSLK